MRFCDRALAAKSVRPAAQSAAFPDGCDLTGDEPCFQIFATGYARCSAALISSRLSTTASAFHLDREAEKYERGGHCPADARRMARIAFGGVDDAKEGDRHRVDSKLMLP
jgi:hypothetical protein